MEICPSRSHAFCAKGQHELYPSLRREHLGHADLMTVRSKPFKVENVGKLFLSATEILNNYVCPG